MISSDVLCYYCLDKTIFIAFSPFVLHISTRLTIFSCLNNCRIFISLSAVIGNYKKRAQIWVMPLKLNNCHILPRSSLNDTVGAKPETTDQQQLPIYPRVEALLCASKNFKAGFGKTIGNTVFIVCRTIAFKHHSYYYHIFPVVYSCIR